MATKNSTKDLYDDPDVVVPKPPVMRGWSPSDRVKSLSPDSEPIITVNGEPDAVQAHPYAEVQTPIHIQGTGKAPDYPTRRVKRDVKVRSTATITNLIDYFQQVGGQDPVWTLLEIQQGKRLVWDPTAQEWYEEEFKGKAPDYKTRAFAASELLSYVYPKRKAVEVTMEKPADMQFVVQADNTPLDVMPGEDEVQELRKHKIEEMRARELANQQ